MRGRAPYFIHYVRDMQRAIAFYRAAFGAPLTTESPGWSTLGFEGFTLALHILSDGHDDRPMPNAGLNLLVDDIEAMQQHIEAAGGRLSELREPDDFVPVRVASFVDSEGNGFELRQEVHD
ncbi:MAG: VOC family protein [Pseudomonadota bacterium]